jgi:hypothetical protein
VKNSKLHCRNTYDMVGGRHEQKQEDAAADKANHAETGRLQNASILEALEPCLQVYTINTI